MHGTYRSSRIIVLLLGVAALLLAGTASADPPARVARLGYASGDVSFSPAGEDGWLLAAMNRPLVAGDRLWTDADARSELQIGSATIRVSSDTGLTLLNLDDRIAQLQLTQGTLNVRVRFFGADDVIEIDTPNLAYSIRQPGEYRIEVDPAGNVTTVIVRAGQAEVYGEGAAYIVNAGQSYRFFSVDLRNNEYMDFSPIDEFDIWASDRDRRMDASISARYVSPDVIGYQDLDEYGMWDTDPMYGNVWLPTRVAAGWAPYSDGRWVWVDPWGWTWLDDAPWGFAVSHYGRWANIRGRWCWVPGPLRERAVYAPAQVAFVGGNAGGVAWFPLGPREVYQPAYPVSRNYFTSINSSNTAVDNSRISNLYNTNVTNVVYVNRQVPGAVIAAPASAFAESQHLSRVGRRMPQEAFTNAPVTAVAAVAPTRASMSGAAREGRKPPREMQQRPFVARNAPPAPPPSFAARERLLATRPGKPLDAAELRTLKRDIPVPSARVRLLPPAQAFDAPAAQRGRPEQPKRAEQRGQPEPFKLPEPLPGVGPIAPLAAPAVRRGQPEQRGWPESRGQPFEPAVRPQAIAPAVPPNEQSGQPEKPGQPEKRRQVEQRRPSEQLPSAPPTLPPALVSPVQRGQTGQGVQPEQRTRPVQRSQPQPVPEVKSAPPTSAHGAEKTPEAVKAEDDRAAKDGAEQQKPDEEKKKREGRGRRGDER